MVAVLTEMPAWPRIGNTPPCVLERAAASAYCSAMDETPHRHAPDWEPPMSSEAELLAALARSDADIAAGRTVPASTVHAELQAALDRIEERRTQRRRTASRR